MDQNEIDLGIVFALSSESGGLIDLMADVKTTTGNGFTYRHGKLGGSNVVVIESGIGSEKASISTESLIEVFRPRRILSAGFAGGLDISLSRNTIVQAGRLIRHTDNKKLILSEEHPATLLTVDKAIATSEEKKRLRHEFSAEIVDMETFAIAEVCMSKNVPIHSLRIIFDDANETLPQDVLRLCGQLEKSTSQLVGSLVGTLFRRPSSVFDLANLKERAIVASDKLAKVIVENNGLSKKQNQI